MKLLVNILATVAFISAASAASVGVDPKYFDTGSAGKRSAQNCPGWADVVARALWSFGQTEEQMLNSFQSWLDRVREAVEAGRLSPSETWASDQRYEVVVKMMINTSVKADDPNVWRDQAIAACEKTMAEKDV